MATIRAAMIAGAGLVVMLGTAPAQAQSGPLQLLPGPGQATRAAKSAPASNAVSKAATRKSAKKATTDPAKKAAAGKADRSKTVARSSTPLRANAVQVAQPKARNSVRTATAATPANARARRPQRQPAQQAIAAALPEVKGIETQENQEALAFAPMPAQQSVRARPTSGPRNLAARDSTREDNARDNVMRDGDSVSLIARLPWWRNDRLQPINYGSEEAESQVLAAAEAWLLANQVVVADAPEAPVVLVADANEVNAIDLALTSVPGPSTPTFWYSLIAILGGTAAAAVVALASARALFA